MIKSSKSALQYDGQQYEKIRVLGKGSYGTAIVHRRLTDHALVVLKEIELNSYKGEKEKLFAWQEAKIMSTLEHSNIIKYYNAYTTETKLIIEMEYASIGTLQAYLSFLCQPLDEQEILIVFKQIANGLNYLHSKQIIHLDLKMANIFVTSDGLVKIGDFGIARFITPVESSDRADVSLDHQGNTTDKGECFSVHQLGTLAYSSPERCLGKQTDFKSDIWSLGCILYEMITLKQLFPAESLIDLVICITRVQHKPIDRADISPQLVALFEQMIAKDPSERPNASETCSLVEQMLAQCCQVPTAGSVRRSMTYRRKPRRRGQGQSQSNKLFDLSTEAAFAAMHQRNNLMSQINYPHSLVYQVRLNSRHILVDRVNLPQTKRIKEISKGKSHYLVLTYDNIVYAWGSKHRGQLGACNLTSSLSSLSSPSNRNISSSSRFIRSARNSITVRDLQRPDDMVSSQMNLSQQMTTSTQPNSLASSTHTIDGPLQPGATSPEIKRPINQHLRQQLVMTMLGKSQPARKPFVINELNNRKIVQVAAGDNFSVFLCKTGVVMTCGDGSSGCLGRGNLASSYTPCMVDCLLNYDIVSIACGPKHVVVLTGNGRAFVWGKFSHGRLGIDPRYSDGYLNQEKSAISNNELTGVSNGAAVDSQGRNNMLGTKYLARPQEMIFPEVHEETGSSDEILIKRVFCGDRCTIFIDNLDRCWACGENRSNKLGLDIRRRFKRTVIVEECWQPRAIEALSNYCIISCSIGESHSCFLTEDKKVIVLGQDIDQSFQFKSMVGIRKQLPVLDSGDLISNESSQRSWKSRTLMLLIKSMLHSNQLAKFKLNFKQMPYDIGNNTISSQLRYGMVTKIKTNRMMRRQVESYLTKSRAIKRMHFDHVLSANCSSNISLALTNDNRVYFWGTRSYERTDTTGSSSGLPTRRKKTTRSLDTQRRSIEPQLVSASSDECFIKIGSTNGSLMSSIQTLGSDHPIIHAQDPRLIAKSLGDLWILDYQPPTPMSVSSSSDDIASLSSSCSCCSCDETIGGTNCGICKEGDHVFYDIQRHDAILEPQPIVSLYVPAAYNMCGTLQVVNMCCFDDDRFFLILDTTTQLAPQHLTFDSRMIANGKQRISSSAQNSRRPSKVPSQVEQKLKLQIVQELKDATPSHSAESDSKAGRSPLIAGLQVNGTIGQSSKARADFTVPDCCRIQEDQQIGEPCSSTNELQHGCHLVDDNVQQSAVISSSDSTLMHNMNTTNNSGSQGGGFSLDEPRSLSTFAGGAIGQHMMIVTNEPMLVINNDGDESMEAIDLERQPATNGSDLQQKHQAATSGAGRLSARRGIAKHNRRQRYRSMANRSESTTMTGECDLDDTSSMPSWVKNEFTIQQQQQDEPSGESEVEANDFQAEEEVTTDGSLTCASDLTCLKMQSTVANFCPNIVAESNGATTARIDIVTESGRERANSFVASNDPPEIIVNSKLNDPQATNKTVQYELKQSHSHPNLVTSKSAGMSLGSTDYVSGIPEINQKDARACLLDCEVYKNSPFSEQHTVDKLDDQLSIGSLCSESSLNQLAASSSRHSLQYELDTKQAHECPSKDASSSSRTVDKLALNNIDHGRGKMSQTAPIFSLNNTNDDYSKNQHTLSLKENSREKDGCASIDGSVAGINIIGGLNKQRQTLVNKSGLSSLHHLSASDSSFEQKSFHNKHSAISNANIKKDKLTSASCSSLSSVRRSLLKLFC